MRRWWRRRWKPPASDPDAGTEARQAVLDAAHRLGHALSQQDQVDATAERLERVNRENHLVPRISAALGAHRE